MNFKTDKQLQSFSYRKWPDRHPTGKSRPKIALQQPKLPHIRRKRAS